MNNQSAGDIRKMINIIESLSKNQNDMIYHYVDEKKLLNIITKNQIKPRWKHYIEKEDRLIVGTSFTWDTTHSTIINMEYPIKMVFDRVKLEKDYKSYLINSNRTYLQTMGIIKPNLYDQTAYKYEDETPDELFVEGVISPLNDYLIDIEILKPINENTNMLIQKYLSQKSITK